MCSCDWNWTCEKCRDTPQDWRWWLDEDSGFERRVEKNEGVSRVDWRDHEVAA